MKSNLPPIDGEDEWPVVYAYTREQAIADGVLVDLTRFTPGCGLRLPVAMTSSSFEETIVRPFLNGYATSSEIERFLTWVRASILGAAQQDKSTSVVVAQYPRSDGGTSNLKIHCGPGDHREPVLTIMFQNED